jgi:hypothetical protein
MRLGAGHAGVALASTYRTGEGAAPAALSATRAGLSVPKERIGKVGCSLSGGVSSLSGVSRAAYLLYHTSIAFSLSLQPFDLAQDRAVSGDERKLVHHEVPEGIGVVFDA